MLSRSDLQTDQTYRHRKPDPSFDTLHLNFSSYMKGPMHPCVKPKHSDFGFSMSPGQFEKAREHQKDTEFNDALEASCSNPPWLRAQG